MNTQLRLNWTHHTRLALGALLVAVLAISAGAALQSCQISPAAQAEVTALDTQAQAHDLDTATLRTQAIEATKAAVAKGVELTAAAAALEAISLGTPVDAEAVTAQQAKVEHLSAEYDAAKAVAIAKRDAATKSAQAAVDARKAADKVAADDLQSHIDPLADVANVLVPGSGPPIKWITAGLLTVPFLSRLLTSRSREHMVAAAKAVLPLDGKVDLIGGAAALARSFGYLHTTDDPIAIARNAASVAAQKGHPALADALDNVARNAHANTVQPLPVGIAVNVESTS